MLEPIFKVSEFNEAINTHLSLLGLVTVEGELSELRIKDGKLLFATIKDKDSCLDLFGLTYRIRNYRELSKGMSVRASGHAGLYRSNSRFHLRLDSLVPEGEGALELAFRQLFQMLREEGLFEENRKRMITRFPEKVALITAKNSSALADFTKIASERFSGVSIDIYPVRVQGREAAEEIASRINYLNDCNQNYDCLIISRGGGSLTDLEAFNTEIVARAVFSSRIPVVSAVGHEDNLTLVDFVSDLRASTPSNAAELIFPNKADLIKELDFLLDSMHKSLRGEITRLRWHLELWQNSLEKTYPSKISKVEDLLLRFQQTGVGLENRQIIFEKEVQNLAQKLQALFQLKLKSSQQQLKHLEILLQSLSHHSILNRGFSLTKKDTGEFITNSQMVRPNDTIQTILKSGTIQSKVQVGA